MPGWRREDASVSRPLPTRHDEAWRYSDLEALASVWPLPAPERIEVPAGASISRVIVQDAVGDAVAVREIEVTLGEGARAEFHVLNVGGRLGRVAIDVTFAQDSHFELGAVILADGDQTLEIVTNMQHAAPGASSNQVVRSVLAGNATGSFLGKVAVARHAQKTDAAQSSKAMLLARTATANAKPELEIFADDVKCAHGATVGELDRNALFYLQSRGIAPAQAKALLLRGFVDAVFADVADAAALERINAVIDAKLEAML